MSGDVLDVVLLLAVVVFAFSGYRQGLLVGVLSFAGFVGGGLLGMRVATAFARSVADATTRPVVALAVVIVAAVLGKALATRLGWAIRQRLTWRPARALDSAGGATISAGSVLLAAWLIGSLVVTSPFPGLVRQVRQSRVLTGVDAVMPMAARTWFSSFRQLVDRQGFPEVFGRIGAPSVAPA